MWFFKNYWLLGQNARNLNYILEHNDEDSKILADSKLKTKDFLSKKWISVSPSIAIVKDIIELDSFDFFSLPLPFVIKPNQWYWGKWIIIIDKIEDEFFIWNDNTKYSQLDLKKHSEEILQWFYSLSWNRDKVIFERKIVLHHSVELLWKYWLPDVRIIVFNLVPVMAMLRVPTQNSKWKANLHMWACWVWIDIWTWKLTNINQFGKSIKSIPWIWDVRNIELPFWQEILLLASKVQNVTSIWYVWCDIVLDDIKWPLLLEVNVRPWLEIQVVNRIPLFERLKKVENIKINSVVKAVRLARDLFGWDIEGKIQNISWKKVLWNKEYITILIQDNPIKSIRVIKTNKDSNYVDTRYLFEDLKIDKSKIKNDTIKLKIDLLWNTKTIKFKIKELEIDKMIIWRDSLYGYLVDPYKYREKDLPFDINNPIIKEKNTVILKNYEEQLLKIDKEIMAIDKKLSILKIITPKNTLPERIKFIESKWTYIPKLEYNTLDINLEEYLEKISKIDIPDIPLSWIYKRKKEEIFNKIYFLQAFKKQDINGLNKYSRYIYGDIIPKNLSYCQDILKTKHLILPEKEYLTVNEVREYVNNFNHIYGLNIGLIEKEIWSRFWVKWNNLYMKNSIYVWIDEIRSVIAHELESHYLRTINWRKSKFTIFWSWTWDYIITEEGIAIYNQSKFIKNTDKKYYRAFERYNLINSSVKGWYKELIKGLLDIYDNDYYVAFSYLLRLKRWIIDVSQNYIFIKDVIYVNGYIDIIDFISSWWDIKELYFWKISLKDLEEIKNGEFINIDTKNIKAPVFYS